MALSKGITISVGDSSLDCSGGYLTYYTTIDRTVPNVSQISLKPHRIIFNKRTTVVYWNDGTKTVVKCAEDETFVEEVGLAMAFMRKLYPKRNEFLRLVKNAYRQEEKVKKIKKVEEVKTEEHLEHVEEPLSDSTDTKESFDGGGIA